MRWRWWLPIGLAGALLAGCGRSGNGAAPGSASAPPGAQGAGDQAAARPDQLAPGANYRRLLSKNRPKWPTPLPKGCAIQAAADVLPSGKVAAARMVKSSCQDVDTLVLDWLKTAEFEPLANNTKGAETQTIVLNWSFDP